MDIYLLSGVVSLMTGLGWLILALLVFPVMPMDNPRVRPVAIVLSTLAGLKNIFAGVFVIYQGVVLGVSAGVHAAAVALVSLDAAYMVVVLFAAIVGIVKWRRRHHGDTKRMDRLEEKQERDLKISEKTWGVVGNVQDTQRQEKIDLGEQQQRVYEELQAQEKRVHEDLGEQQEQVRKDLGEERKRKEES